MDRVAAIAVSVLIVAAAGWSGVACAQRTTPGDALPGPEWMAVAPARLDDLRGGYALPSGLMVAFGFQRTVQVNGELVSALRVDIPDLGRITPQQAQELARLQAGERVQIGAGNAAPIGGGLVIQNTLDGQDIRATTTIDVRTNALGLFQALNAGDAAQRALIGSTGGP